MITYEELAPDLWADLATLFGRNGAQEGCWCVWWRILAELVMRGAFGFQKCVATCTVRSFRSSDGARCVRE